MINCRARVGADGVGRRRVGPRRRNDRRAAGGAALLAAPLLSRADAAKPARRADGLAVLRAFDEAPTTPSARTVVELAYDALCAKNLNIRLQYFFPCLLCTGNAYQPHSQLISH